MVCQIHNFLRKTAYDDAPMRRKALANGASIGKPSLFRDISAEQNMGSILARGVCIRRRVAARHINSPTAFHAAFYAGHSTDSWTADSVY